MRRLARDVTMAVVVEDDIFPEQGVVKSVGMDRFS